MRRASIRLRVRRCSRKPSSIVQTSVAAEYAHRDSFTALLGADASPDMLHYMSLETQVTKDTVPCFLWQTVTDELVPVENSCMMAQALKKEKAPAYLASGSEQYFRGGKKIMPNDPCPCGSGKKYKKCHGRNAR